MNDVDTLHPMKSTNGTYIALSGGVGGAKLVLGLSQALPPGALRIVANTGDDFVHHGLNISPDIDTLLYTLSGLSNKDVGWGRRDETWNYMQACEELGLDTWFRLGDKDLAIHIYRSQRLAQGATLSEVVAELCIRLGVGDSIVPMSEDPVRTFVESEIGRLPFQEYFVKHACQPVVSDIQFVGKDTAEPASGFISALESDSLQAIIICPSNPFLSIYPIIALAGIRQRLARHKAPCIIVSPIVEGHAIKGPTAKLMKELQLDCNVTAIADMYADIADAIVIDSRDATHTADIETKGLRVLETHIIMQTLEDKIRLANEVIDLVHHLRSTENN